MDPNRLEYSAEEDNFMDIFVHNEEPLLRSVSDLSITNTSDHKSDGFMHASEKKYQCNQCSKIYSNNSSLTRHMLVHTGEKNTSVHIL